jgi:group I intron endonuclease
MINIYCLYSHLNPVTKQPFYIGVSSNLKRPYNFSERNPIWKRYVKKHGNPIVEILYENLTKDEIHLLEQELIKKYGRKSINPSGLLVNISEGGDGGSKGVKWSSEQNKKRSESLKGKKHSQETKALMRELKLGKQASDETKQKMSKTKSGVKQPNISKARTGVKQPQSFFDKKNKPVNQLSLTGKIIKSFPSIKEAAQYVNISEGGINACLKSRQITAGGYKWEYVN